MSRAIFPPPLAPTWRLRASFTFAFYTVLRKLDLFASWDPKVGSTHTVGCLSSTVVAYVVAIADNTRRPLLATALYNGPRVTEWVLRTFSRVDENTCSFTNVLCSEYDAMDKVRKSNVLDYFLSSFSGFVSDAYCRLCKKVELQMVSKRVTCSVVYLLTLMFIVSRCEPKVAEKIRLHTRIHRVRNDSYFYYISASCCNT
jgi:hypothetical protein